MLLNSSGNYESHAMMIFVNETAWIFLHSASFSLKSFVGSCGRNVTNVIPLLWSQSGKQDTLPSATELKRYLKKKNFLVIIDLNLMWLCFKTYISWTHHPSDWNIDRYNFGMMEILTSYWTKSLIISPGAANNKGKGQALFNWIEFSFCALLVLSLWLKKKIPDGLTLRISSWNMTILRGLLTYILKHLPIHKLKATVT